MEYRLCQCLDPTEIEGSQFFTVTVGLLSVAFFSCVSHIYNNMEKVSNLF